MARQRVYTHARWRHQTRRYSMKIHSPRAVDCETRVHVEISKFGTAKKNPEGFKFRHLLEVAVERFVLGCPGVFLLLCVARVLPQRCDFVPKVIQLYLTLLLQSGKSKRVVPPLRTFQVCRKRWTTPVCGRPIKMIAQSKQTIMVCTMNVGIHKSTYYQDLVHINC